ncbi:MAG: beta-ketoacyl-ACP synthase 3 [Vicinamibacterales bacterium]
MKTTRPVRIAGLATYVPPKVLTNADLEKMVETSDEWILQRTGIRERHIAEPGVGTSDLAAPAARAAIEEAGLTPADIGFIVVGTTTPDTIFPSTACTLQAKIGASNAWGFDLGAACSGFTYSLSVAFEMVATGAVEHALVVGADVMSSIIDYTDRATCVIFGDGAGAVVLSPAAEGSRRSSTSCTSPTARAAPRCACPPAAAAARHRTRRWTSACTTSSRTGRPSSSSRCG